MLVVSVVTDGKFAISLHFFNMNEVSFADKILKSFVCADFTRGLMRVMGRTIMGFGITLLVL